MKKIGGPRFRFKFSFLRLFVYYFFDFLNMLEIFKIFAMADIVCFVDVFSHVWYFSTRSCPICRCLVTSR